MSFRHNHNDDLIEANRAERRRAEADAVSALQTDLDGYTARRDGETILGQFRRAMKIARVEGRVDVARCLSAFDAGARAAISDPVANVDSLVRELVKREVNTRIDEKIARLERERDEAEALAWPGEHRFPDLSYKAMHEQLVSDLRRTERERDELASQLAALREAALIHQSTAHLWDREVSSAEEFAESMGTLIDADSRLCEALAATAPAVEAYIRRVQAEECERAISIVAARKTTEIITGERAVAMDVDGKRPLRALVAGCAAGAIADVEDALRARAAELRGGR